MSKNMKKITIPIIITIIIIILAVTIILVLNKNKLKAIENNAEIENTYNKEEEENIETFDITELLNPDNSMQEMDSNMEELDINNIE